MINKKITLFKLHIKRSRKFPNTVTMTAKIRRAFKLTNYFRLNLTIFAKHSPLLLCALFFFDIFNVNRWDFASRQFGNYQAERPSKQLGDRSKTAVRHNKRPTFCTITRR